MRCNINSESQSSTPHSANDMVKRACPEMWLYTTLLWFHINTDENINKEVLWDNKLDGGVETIITHFGGWILNDIFEFVLIGIIPHRENLNDPSWIIMISNKQP